MTSRTQDYYLQKIKEEKMLKYLQEMFPFLDETISHIDNYLAKKYGGDSKKTRHPDYDGIVFRHKKDIYGVFAGSIEVEEDLLLFDKYIQMEGLEECLMKNLDTFPKKHVDCILYDLTLKYVFSEDFTHKLFFNFLKALHNNDIEKVRHTSDFIEDYYPYFVSIISLQLEDVKEIDLYYFIEQTSYHACPGYLIAPLKAYIYYSFHPEIPIDLKQYQNSIAHTEDFYKPSIYCDNFKVVAEIGKYPKRK